ncbi:MAG: cysteine desulfurase [Chloroflexota bacterium]|mgnify:FL=1
MLDVTAIRRDFPILNQMHHDNVPLVYLDNAATSQKPECVIRALDEYYRTYNANIHRGIHKLAEAATAAYEGARERVRAFINAASPREIIFTRNTTEAINLVAHSWARANLREGDIIILSEMEHHSNLVPWQILAAERGVRLEFIPITEDGHLDLAAFDRLLELQPRLVSIVHMSNVLGTINPIAEIVARAHAVGAVVLVDGAQSVPHLPVDVRALDCDFLAFSGHKMCGPTGIGVLYGKRALLEAMPPFLGGGDMIKRVYLREFRPNDLPWKFEAGTPAIAEGIGLGVAVDYLSKLGMAEVHAHEQAIVRYAMEQLSEIKGLRILGPSANERGGVVAFTLEGIHPHDISQLLDRDGIAIRAGHHCCMPLHDRLGIVASARASFYVYNIEEEVDLLVQSLYRAMDLFGV